MVRVKTIHVHTVFFLIFFVLDGIVTGFFAHVVVILENYFIMFFFFASVPEIRFCKQFATRTCVTEIRISVGNRILRKNRAENCIQNQN